MGILVAIEGIDGAGKTTQVGLLCEALQAAGEEVVRSKEPTDGPWGQKIRQSAQTGRMPLDEELHAFIEDRKEHIASTIRPCLDAGKIVILDRYFYSTIAYQGARGTEPEELFTRMKSFAPIPDVVLLLDVPPAIGVARISGGRGEVPNQFEAAGELAKVRRIFHWLAAADPCIKMLEGQRSVADVHRDILETLIEGVLKRCRAKPYECECWYCSSGATNSCRWLTLQEKLRSRAKAMLKPVHA